MSYLLTNKHADSNFLTKIFCNYTNKRNISELHKKYSYYFIYRLFRRFLNANIIVRVHNFLIYASHLKSEWSHCILRKNQIDLGELALIKLISSHSKVYLIDCGANHGYYSLYTSSISANNKVTAIEASKHTYLKLTKNVELNQFKNISMINKAVSNVSNKTVTFFESDFDWESATSNATFNSKNSYSVQTIAIDDFVDKDDTLPYTMILKIDVEGNEQQTLEGAKNTVKAFAPIIIIEISNYNDGFLKFFETFTTENDYIMYTVGDYRVIDHHELDSLIKLLPKKNYTIGNLILVKKNCATKDLINNLKIETS